MQLSDFGTASFDSFFRPYRVHQDGVKSSQVTGNEIVSVNTPYLISKFTIANFSLSHTNLHIFYTNQTFRPFETSESAPWGRYLGIYLVCCWDPETFNLYQS